MQSCHNIEKRGSIKKRIIYIHQYFATRHMVGGTRSFEMARRLAARGYDVHVVTSAQTVSGQESRSWSTTNEAGVTVHWYPVPYSNLMGYYERIRAFVSFAVRAAFKAASLKGDLVFATSTPLTVAIPALYASKRNRIPMVFEVRDLWPELPIVAGILRNPFLIWLARKMEEAAYRNSRAIIALSPGMKEGVTRTGYPADRVHVVPNSCDLDLFSVDPQEGLKFRRRFDWLGSRPLAVYTGTIGYINGLDYLISLAREVRNIDSEIRFLLVGEGGEKRRIERLAAEYGVLNQNLFFFGKVRKEEIPTILSAADVATCFFMNYKEMWNNSANKFFDALAAGRPVAINYGGWQSDMIRQYGIGIALDPEDVREAARLLVSGMRDRDWLSGAGERAKKLAREQFSRDKTVEAFERVLEGIV